MRNMVLAVGLLIPLFAATGCKEDNRSREEKQFAPAPEFSTRHIMPCPHCKAAQKPYRIDAIKSYYRCSGQPPKFAYHEERKWSHRIADHDHSVEH